MTDEAKRVRYALVQMHHKAQTGHLGGALSMVEILLAVHGKGRVIVSKGHAISAWYAVCVERGRNNAVQLGFSLPDFNRQGSNLPEQPRPGGAFTEWATGSLGHGLSVGLGFALADKLKGDPTRTFVVMSDGECQEGSVWEAAMLAHSLKLTNLTVVVDANEWQATCRTLVSQDRLAHQWEGFGWNVRTPWVDLIDLCIQQSNGLDAIVTHTKKGLGISFMEDDLNWHYKHPSADDVERARIELGQP